MSTSNLRTTLMYGGKSIRESLQTAKIWAADNPRAIIKDIEIVLTVSDLDKVRIDDFPDGALIHRVRIKYWEKLKSAGRDFLRAVAEQGLEFGPDRWTCMRQGDYIDMPVGEFRSWVCFHSSNLHCLPEAGNVRVSIITVIEDEKPPLIVAEAAGARKRVHASLFYNYGQAFTG